MRAFLWAVIAAAGCSSVPMIPEPHGDGLQYFGSITVGSSSSQTVELSAQLLPDARVFQQFQFGGYETIGEAERMRLIDEDVHTYEALLPVCASKHPAIRIAIAGGAPLSAEQIAINYDEMARCAYEDYGAKPYWVPRQVDEIDICDRKLGSGWRLPSENVIAGLSESEFQFFADTLTTQPNADLFPAHFYYSLDVFVRGSDGALALGNLAPAAAHVSALPVSADDLDSLYIGDGRPIGLRCLRVSPTGS